MFVRVVGYTKINMLVHRYARSLRGCASVAAYGG